MMNFTPPVNAPGNTRYRLRSTRRSKYSPAAMTGHFKWRRLFVVDPSGTFAVHVESETTKLDPDSFGKDWYKRLI